MLTAKFVNVYGMVSIAIMLLMLALIWLKKVPESMYVTLFLIAIALFAGRVTLRLLLARKERSMKAQAPPPGQEGKPE